MQSASAKARDTRLKLDTMNLLGRDATTPRKGRGGPNRRQEAEGGARERNARRAGTGEPQSKATGKGRSPSDTTGTAGGVAPTAPESSAQAKHWPHFDGAGLESCFEPSCPVAWPRSCNATACCPTTSARASQRTEAKRWNRVIRNASLHRRARTIGR